MYKHLDKIQDLLDDFEMELSNVRAIWKKIEIDNLDFEQVSEDNYQEKHARMWLHGATRVDERNELERWLHGYPPATKTANASAQDVYEAWQGWLKKQGDWGAYYMDFQEFQIVEPKDKETLIQFITRLSQTIADECKKHYLRWRALRSFLNFIREYYISTTEPVAFIEHIFPKKMDLYHGKIRRLIPLEAYPIPEKTAADILIEFARRCRNGRPDARHTAVEGMALCWLCIASSRIRLPKTLEMVGSIEGTAVLSGVEFSISTIPTYGSECIASNRFNDAAFSVLQVPTWFGNQPLKISNRIASFLNLVSQIPAKKARKTILQRPMGSLRRLFDEVLHSVAPPSEYGNITYLSLLNQPHIFGDHRPQPNH